MHADDLVDLRERRARVADAFAHDAERDAADEEVEDAYGAVPAYDTGATLRVCEFCRGFCDPAVPLQVPTYEHFRAGWDLRAVIDDGDGDAT